MRKTFLSSASSLRFLLPVILLLWLYAFTRWHEALSFPIFLDEADHIDWADDLYRLKPFTGALNGKLFGLWWMAAFDLEGDSAIWLARAVTALFCLPGVAALMSLGRHFGARGAGLLLALLYTAAPYAFFYDRLALMDTYVVTWGLLVAWLAVRAARRMQPFNAAGTGIALIGALLAKATGIFLAVIPLLAMLLLSRASWRQRIRQIVVIYAVFAVFWLPFYILLLSRGYSYFGTATTIVGTGSASGVLERLPANLLEILTIDSVYFHPLALLIMGLLSLFYMVRRPREGLFLAGTLLLPPAALLAFATKLSPRYFQFHVPFLLLFATAGFFAFTNKYGNMQTLLHGQGEQVTDLPLRKLPSPFGEGQGVRSNILRKLRHRFENGTTREAGQGFRLMQAITAIGIVIWLLGGFAFQIQYFADPASLPLPRLDRLEYIQSDAAGFALPEVADFLQSEAAQQNTTIIVHGWLANCKALAYTLPDAAPVTLECPGISADEARQQAFIASVNQAAEASSPGTLWLIFEPRQFLELTDFPSLHPVTTFTRPDALVTLHVLNNEARKSGN